MIERINYTSLGFVTSFGGIYFANKFNTPIPRIVALTVIALHAVVAVYKSQSSKNSNIVERSYSQGYLVGCAAQIGFNLSKIRKSVFINENFIAHPKAIPYPMNRK